MKNGIVLLGIIIVVAGLVVLAQYKLVFVTVSEPPEGEFGVIEQKFSHVEYPYLKEGAILILLGFVTVVIGIYIPSNKT